MTERPCLSRYYFTDGTSVGCERGEHPLPAPKPEEHLCEVTLRWKGERGGDVPVTVWVAETWSAHGEATTVLGVYATREGAFRALKALENMTVYVDDHGDVQARPKREPAWQWPPRRPYVPVKWGHAFPREVQE